MKALILAAGLGSRLAPLTNTKPKSLVPVNGIPIIIKQIENLRENGITDISIISGYKSEILETEVHAGYLDINIIKNTDYDKTNNMYSAYLGKEAVCDDDFLMMNADVFFDSSVIKGLLSFSHTDAIVVDIGRYMEESMKVVEKKGKIVEISKNILPDKALGCSIDVYKFSKRSGMKFFDKCYEYIEIKKELNKWSEVALNDILEDTDFHSCPLTGRWFEIDNLDDLSHAEKLFTD